MMNQIKNPTPTPLTIIAQKRNACNKSTVNDRNTKTGIFVQLPLFSSNVNVQHKNHHHHHHA
jgi:hypothetical protein